MELRAGILVAALLALALVSACIPIPDMTEPIPAKNGVPIADAWVQQEVEGGSDVELDGSASSDPDGDVLVYVWRQIAGPNTVLVNAGTAKASFGTPDVDRPTSMSFQLSLDDGHGGRNAAIVAVLVRPATNTQAETDAQAGEDQTVPAGALVTLSGSARGGVGSIAYTWTQDLSQSGLTVVLSADDVPSPTFSAPELTDGVTLVFVLGVQDEAGSSDSDEVTVIVAGILAAQAGADQAVLEETQATLNGSVRGGVGQSSFAWLQTAGPDVVLDNPNSATPTFTVPDVEQTTTLTFELTVTDETNQTASDTVDVEIVLGFTALAGADQTVWPGQTVTLQGDAVGGEGDTTYEWRQTDGPNVVLTDPNAQSPMFAAPLVEDDTTLTFELTATDEALDTATDTIDIVVDAPEVRFSTTMGDFVILLRPDAAPLGIENFLRYVNEDFYPGLIMHRVIPDFVVQGGGWGPDLDQTYRYGGIPLESQNGLFNQRGWVAYARTADPDSASSEFYVNLIDNTDLDYISPQEPGYAVFGKIIEGMDVIDAMAKVETHDESPAWDPNATFEDVPVVDIVIIDVTLE